MRTQNHARRLALALRHAGLVLMTLSLAAALLRSGAGSALAAPVVDMRNLVAQVIPVPGLGTPVPDGTPTPAAATSIGPAPVAKPTPTPKPEVGRGGPLTFSLTGNLSFGERGYSSTRGDSSSPGGLTTFGQSIATNNAGMLIQLQRRTGSTTLTFGLPVGVSSSQRTNVGQIQAGYYTPHFGLQYIPQPLSALGAIPIGSTVNGLSVILPLHGGDISTFGGTGYLDNFSHANVVGVRARSLLGRNLFELGLMRARTPDGSEDSNSLIAGFASDNGNLNQIFEGALQRNRSDLGSKDASAYQYRLDYGSSTTYSTLALRRTGIGFESVGSGALPGDDQVSGGFRTGAFTLNETLDRATTEGDVTRSRQSALSFTHSFRGKQPVETLLSFTEQRSQDAIGATWLGSAGAQFESSFKNLTAIVGAQGTRSTSASAAPLGSMMYQGQLQDQFGTYLAQAQYQLVRQTSLGSFNKVGTSSLALSRQWGLTQLTLSDTLTRTQSPISDALQAAPLVTLSRQLSPAVTLALSYGLQSTHDALNPSSNGRSRIFNLQLTAPFAIGSGLVQGRPNPRLPASISGSVINDVGNQGAFTSTVSNGVGNVMVVLDNSQIQRTDLSGRFQFNFVTPGHHTVQIQLSSLPRGVTPDQPIASVDVLGGQQAQVYFQIGTYGGVQGHVYGRDSDGQLTPISNAMLTIDKNGPTAITGSNGEYGFGKLFAGTHTITVAVASLPATVSLAQDTTTQKVTVLNGVIATLDFTASPLGSIAGRVVYDDALAPDFKGGVLNAYVVAEPGDYAAITNEDGSFLLDNVPPGTYTLDVDPETVPADTGNISGSQAITLKSLEHVEGVQFRIGHKEKQVVFSFKATEAASASMTLQESTLPPGGSTEVSVDADEKARSVTLNAFDKTYPLTYSRSRKKWIGTVDVPLHTGAGTVTLLADVKGSQNATASADLKVDPSMQIATFVTTPRHPARGQYADVRARFLADVRAGDSIRWVDGQITKLSRPITGRVFEFTVKISEQPMAGTLLTRQGQLPITLR